MKEKAQCSPTAAALQKKPGLTLSSQGQRPWPQGAGWGKPVCTSQRTGCWGKLLPRAGGIGGRALLGTDGEVR
jgi:hypothetical protein